jgi:hypothetical protein
VLLCFFVTGRAANCLGGISSGSRGLYYRRMENKRSMAMP